MIGERRMKVKKYLKAVNKRIKENRSFYEPDCEFKDKCYCKSFYNCSSCIRNKKVKGNHYVPNFWPPLRI